MALITLYYLQMASEQILNRNYYNCSKGLLFLSYLTIMGLMITGWGFIYSQIS